MTSRHRYIALGSSKINDESFGISQSDLRRHLFTIGTTGSGKSTLLEGIAIQLIHQNAGVTFLDPHGDSAERLLAAIPNHRIQDVIYFNAADLDFPIAFNPLAVVDSDQRAVVAESIVSAFKGIWGDSWGARMERIFIIATQTLLACPGETILGINRLFTDASYRAGIVQRISDPALRDFWEQEYETWVKRRHDSEYTEPIKNKVGRLTHNPVTRNILGQSRSKLDLDRVVNRGKILIVNLSKGAIGDQIANFLGSLLVSSIIDTAMGRGDIPEENRRDHVLIADEFHSFATSRFATALSEARKYRLSIIVGQQYLAQLSKQLEDVRHAVFGNVGSFVAFKVGNQDAGRIAEQFDDEYAPRSFVELDPHHVIAKLTHLGRTGQPFAGKSLPPLLFDYQNSQKIAKRSQRFYGTPRKTVEKKIRCWLRYNGVHAKEIRSPKPKRKW